MPRASLISLPPLPHRSRVGLPPGVRRTDLPRLTEQQVLPARCLRPAPKTNQLRNDVSLVVETAPRRCNHLTRAPIARQASTNPALNSARVLREREPGSSRPGEGISSENFGVTVSICEISQRSHEKNFIKNKRCRSRARLGQNWCELNYFSHSTIERSNLLKLSVIRCEEQFCCPVTILPRNNTWM